MLPDTWLDIPKFLGVPRWAPSQLWLKITGQRLYDSIVSILHMKTIMNSYEFCRSKWVPHVCATMIHVCRSLYVVHVPLPPWTKKDPVLFRWFSAGSSVNPWISGGPYGMMSDAVRHGTLHTLCLYICDTTIEHGHL